MRNVSRGVSPRATNQGKGSRWKTTAGYPERRGDRVRDTWYVTGAIPIVLSAKRTRAPLR